MKRMTCWLAFGASFLSWNALAETSYKIENILIPDDQTASADTQQTQLYKPHEVAIDKRPFWFTSNERSGFAGITLFHKGSNKVMALVNIEEPGLEFSEEPEEEDIDEHLVVEPEPHFPSEIRFNPTVCLPIKLYPGSELPEFVEVDEETGEETVYTPSLWDEDPSYVCAPLGAESHARHPHGIDVDKRRKLVYQVIEHSGLRWNSDRSGFEVAETTDDESGMLLVYDIRKPHKPEIVDGFLLGHGAHEVAVNERNGKVFQGNHEDSPGVEPNIWVDVIDRKAWKNPYGFIDTGFYNAVQGIEVDERLNVVFGTTHVGEKMFAFSGNCKPTRNHPPTIVDYNLDPDIEEPFVEKAMGENCILYTVDLREPFLEQVAHAEELFELADTAITEAIEAGEEPTALPSVLHMHDLTVDRRNHRAYQTVHGIHHAEHTGSPEEAALPEEVHVDEEPPADEEPPVVEEEVEIDIMGRWLAEVDVDPESETFQQVRYIDLSNGWDALSYPGTEDLPEGTSFDQMFIHAHWVAVDPKRETILVTGEHTGNLGVVEAEEDLDDTPELEQVIAISRTIPDCVPPLDETGAPELGEPHVHGVQIDQRYGRAYVSDEGEGCFYESVTVLKPMDDQD